ncbi:MAG: cell envelope integrity protein TolA [Deltaproteobacteria bacterium]|nr:cell envelope integrity protein TolA [Deltaproteobacteria bacterium]
MIRKKKKINLFQIALIVSFLLHIILFLIPLKFVPETAEKLIKIVRIDPEELPQKQIIDDNGTPDKKETPDQDTRFLSKHNRKVEKETRAQNVGPTINNPSIPQKIQPQEESAKSKIMDKESMLLALSKPQAERKIAEKKQNNIDLPLSQRNLSHLKPSATDDYLPDKEIGEETLLNSKQFKFYSFYERIKEKLRTQWGHNLKSVFQNQNFTNASLTKDLVTKLKIQLRNNGSLKQILVLSSSGYTDVDNAAIAAFESAAPFPNPPSGMIEKDGTIQLRWDFIIQSDKGPFIKVFLSKI